MREKAQPNLSILAATAAWQGAEQPAALSTWLTYAQLISYYKKAEDMFSKERLEETQKRLFALIEGAFSKGEPMKANREHLESHGMKTLCHETLPRLIEDSKKEHGFTWDIFPYSFLMVEYDTILNPYSLETLLRYNAMIEQCDTLQEYTERPSQNWSNGLHQRFCTKVMEVLHSGKALTGDAETLVAASAMDRCQRMMKQASTYSKEGHYASAIPYFFLTAQCLSLITPHQDLTLYAYKELAQACDNHSKQLLMHNTDQEAMDIFLRRVGRLDFNPTASDSFSAFHQAVTFLLERKASYIDPSSTYDLLSTAKDINEEAFFFQEYAFSTSQKCDIVTMTPPPPRRVNQEKPHENHPIHANGKRKQPDDRLTKPSRKTSETEAKRKRGENSYIPLPLPRIEDLPSLIDIGDNEPSPAATPWQERVKPLPKTLGYYSAPGAASDTPPNGWHL